MSISNPYNLNRIIYFVAVVEEKTITAAANRLNLSKAVVSKHLQLLEDELGVSLFIRNTRHMNLTDAGQAFYLHCKTILDQADIAFESVVESSKEPSGALRIAAPVDFGVFHLPHIVAKFSQQYPKISIESVLGDGIVDVVSERFDLSFRIGWLHDSSNRARRLGDFRPLLVCSPAFIERFNPNTPEQLQRLPFLEHQASARSRRILSHKSNASQEIHLTANIRFNVTFALSEALLAGQHFAILPDFTVQKQLQDGQLVELLPDWKLGAGGIYVVSPATTHRTEIVRLFLNAVYQHFGQD